MNEKALDFNSDGGRELGQAARMKSLIEEVQAVKLMSLQYVVRSSQGDGSVPEGEVLRHAQVVLKAAEVQLRLLAAQVKCEGGPDLPLELAVIWKAISGVSQLRPLLHRAQVLEGIKSNLREFTAECGGADAVETADGQPGEDDNGETGDAAIQ